ncbi:uncharacterized protein [Rutidosis leptorrhynchoides]|uniref:uncharacterized protein n=1 Tax=Rutidosis leptorrhynchoides TaxID=125765 RepID=UPI003A990E0C
MEPILGMRFASLEQLKHSLINYGVANGYQLWYKRNDCRQLQVMCGRDVSKGLCAGGHLKRKKKGVNGEKVDVKKRGRAKLMRKAKAKVVKGKKYKCRSKPIDGCPFRLYASWMQSEYSFQIKTLIKDHNCSRQFDLGSLVTYKWITIQCLPMIIENPTISYRNMRSEIKRNYLINVSLGECIRAKQIALFKHEGGLKEHYSRLWDYKDALLKSNPDSTVKIDVDQGATCKGELLTAMGRDANNHIYPIAWDVVGVENKDNWCWFIASLAEDLDLGNGEFLTIISDGQKGLIEAVNMCLSGAEHRQ